ncbi:hypothetical protein GGX14DRAFT_465516 [Mycena pura]|uniref:SHSP domain-containing protein n=1 Tax=Mycena pura TaxID=153505 RepID=A0AAD6Y4J0_9AGAR|nr:hypothetical protein GGX14DRAFT_465516 [Mycena pura]
MAPLTDLNIPCSVSQTATCQRNNAPKCNPYISRLQLPNAKTSKKASFGLLSVCENQRVPSRMFSACSIIGVSNIRRTCAVRLTSSPSARGGDRARNPWSVNFRRGSSLAPVDNRLSLSSRVPAAPAPYSEGLRLLPSVSVPAIPTSSPSVPQIAPSKPVSGPVVSTLQRPPPTPSSEHRRLSVTARARRVPSTSRYPPMHINSSTTSYTMEISLPSAIKPEMVTITTGRGDKLRIVADAWHLEIDCHYEWEISFPEHDVDMTSIRAKFDDKGRLYVSAERC